MPPAFQVGALSYTPNGTPPPPAEETTEEPAAAALGEGESASVEDSWDAPLTAAPIERAEEIVQRLRRELSRTISAARTANELSVVYISGFQLPGLTGADILGVPLLPFEGCDILDDEEGVHSEYRSGAVAFGAALGRLGGGPMEASLRREELKFTGTMERLELPLAVLALLVVTFLGVWSIFIHHERERIDDDLTFMVNSSANYLLGDKAKGKAGNLTDPPEVVKKYLDRTTGRIPGTEPAQSRIDPNLNRYEQLGFILSLIKAENDKLKRQLGEGSDLTQPQSALRALTLVLDVLAQGEDKYGRTSLRGLKANYSSGGKQEHVVVDLTLAFVADSTVVATAHYEQFYTDLEDYPWFLELKRPQSEAILEDQGAERGAYLQGLTIKVDVTAAEDAGKGGEAKS